MDNHNLPPTPALQTDRQINLAESSSTDGDCPDESAMPVSVEVLSLIDALTLDHGVGFGRRFYRRRSRADLVRTVQKLNASSLNEVFDCLRDSLVAAGPVRGCRGPKRRKRALKERS
jgi:hypothetical protein